MDPRKVKNAADARKIVSERELDCVQVGVFDIDAILRGKYMSKAKLLSALDGGFDFCDVVLGWDSKDPLYDNVSYAGWHTGYPDAPVWVIPESCREIPWENGMLMFLGEFTDKAKEICSRGILRKILKKTDKMGYRVFSGLEYEFLVFE